MFARTPLSVASVSALLLLATAAGAEAEVAVPAGISGDYLEARTADVWTGPCFANGEMGLEGKEAILAWRIDRGAWNGVALAGLAVVAVVEAQGTLGDPDAVRGVPRSVLLVDERGSAEQRQALAAFAREMGGELTAQVVEVETSPIETDFGGAPGFARVRAGQVAEIETRALTHHDRHCGNEIVFYPPLTQAQASPAATVSHAYRGRQLGVTWSSPGKRSAFVGTFSR